MSASCISSPSFPSVQFEQIVRVVGRSLPRSDADGGHGRVVISDTPL